VSFQNGPFGIGVEAAYLLAEPEWFAAQNFLVSQCGIAGNVLNSDLPLVELWMGNRALLRIL